MFLPNVWQQFNLVFSAFSANFLCVLRG